MNVRKTLQKAAGKEDAKMEMLERKIDFKKLTFSKKPMPTAESIKDVIPMQWSKEVCSGSKKIVMTHPEKRETGE